MMILTGGAMSHNARDVIEWVKRNMEKRRVTQENLGGILNLSQPAINNRLSDEPGKTRFKLDEIEKLEKEFGELSPLRDPDATNGAGKIDADVLRAVLMHIGREYPRILRVDPHEFSDAVIAMCEFIYSNDSRPITKAESRLALRGITVLND
jgi:transcriptional regulator with XRE-family HTH domain